MACENRKPTPLKQQQENCSLSLTQSFSGAEPGMIYPNPKEARVAVSSLHPVTLSRPSRGLSAGSRGELHLTGTGGKRQNEVVGNGTPLSPPTHPGVNQQESELTSPLEGKEVVQVEVAASQGPTFTRAKGKLSYYLTCLLRGPVNSALPLPEWCYRSPAGSYLIYQALAA